MSKALKSSRISFRADDALRNELVKLADESKQDMSDICRFGFRAQFPAIRRMVLAQPGPLPTDPAGIEALRRTFEKLDALAEMGANIEQELDRLLAKAGEPKLLPTGSTG